MSSLAALRQDLGLWLMPRPAAGATVLLAIAERSMRRHLALRLVLEGHHVVEAENGLSFLAQVEELLGEDSSQTLILVVDETMPGRATLLDAARRMKDPPALICTLGGAEVAMSVSRRAVVQHFRRPIDTDRLVAACSRAKARAEVVPLPFGDGAADPPRTLEEVT